VLPLADTSVQGSNFRDLGFYLDNELQTKHHVNKVAITCYYHLRRLFQLRRRLSNLSWHNWLRRGSVTQ